MLISQPGNGHHLFLFMKCFLWIPNDLNTVKSYNDTPNHRAQGKEPLHYIILLKANIYVKIPLSALNIHGVTVSCVYSCAAGRGTGAGCNSAKQKLRKSGICEVCARRHGQRGEEELGRALMLGCIVGLFISHLRAGVNHSAPPFLKLIQKGVSKSWICNCSLRAFFRYFSCSRRNLY